MGSLPGVNFATVFFTHKDRDQVRALVQGARLAPAGRDRPRRRRGQPLRHRRLPHHRLRARRRPRGDDQARQPHRGPAAPARARGSRADDRARSSPRAGSSAELAEEFPELGLVHAPVETAPAAQPRARSSAGCGVLADRYTGGKVIHMRQDAVPWAYRVFFAPGRRSTPTPTARRSSAIALERLRHGGLKSEQPRRRRADDRHRRDRRAGARARRRQADRRAGTAPGAAGRGAGGRAAAVGAPAGRRRRGPPGGARARRGRPRRGRHPGHRAHAALRRCASRACRRSRSRKRFGSPQRRFTLDPCCCSRLPPTRAADPS